jgi:hypothetical protein
MVEKAEGAESPNADYISSGWLPQSYEVTLLTATPGQGESVVNDCLRLSEDHAIDHKMKKGSRIST